MKRVAIFASGTGSNAQKITEYAQESKEYEVVCMLSNKKTAKVLDFAHEKKIDTFTFNRTEFYDTDMVSNYLKRHQIDLVVLAGFLWLIPPNLISTFPNRIVNIHPALLPKYGGKGMYGNYIHNAVRNAAEKVSGITIHLVNEHYDEGRYIFQSKVRLNPADDTNAIAAKVLRLEHHFYPRVVHGLCKKI
jgi:phosphoribosylglycinamide formyltransferase 1